MKPGYEMFVPDQLSREVIDVANATGAVRIACVMVGADLGRPAGTSGWEASIDGVGIKRFPDNGRSRAPEAQVVLSSQGLQREQHFA